MRPIDIVSFQALQSGGPRTTPSGYPGGPIVPSGQLSPQHAQAARPAQHIGYSTTGRMSVHQHQQAAQQAQQPVTFTRAMEMSKSIGQSLNEPTGEAAAAGARMHVSSSGADIKMQNVKQNSGTASGSAGGESSGEKRDSVYDVNSYEISV